MRRLLTEREAATELSLSIRTLQQWRVRGVGPSFLKLGRAVRYDADTLEAWLADQSRTNTVA
ncbi:helix-turn-helix domain-containing protein [Thiorhodococcus mannitoliphagus]|uniref:Helix-turn-helix domain-containing protein n=2 Tax=Thiorhodococcus mannitoliphagus TaxID=329406 RepID=A0A6P1DZI7_9GAMM|nr:helix-turn-helix domain-containing protein [Thiorhodococcus mannitoliphagus]